MPRKKPPLRLPYATDLTDGQWALIEPMILPAEPGGRPRKATTRELVDAILDFLRAGGGRRLLPHDLPPWQTVYYYLRRWQREGVWDLGPGSSCAGDGRPRAHRPRALPKGGDPRQPVRAHRRPKGGSKGFDAGKKISGRKHHILTDTDGRLLAVQVHGAMSGGPPTRKGRSSMAFRSHAVMSTACEREVWDLAGQDEVRGTAPDQFSTLEAL